MQSSNAFYINNARKPGVIISTTSFPLCIVYAFPLKLAKRLLYCSSTGTFGRGPVSTPIIATNVSAVKGLESRTVSFGFMF